MDQPKFSLNSLLVVVLAFSAVLFLVTLLVPGAVERTVINDYYQIEGTDYAILYSDKKPSGIYEGSQQSGTLKLEGSFGHDWGVVLQEPYLYVNEYTYTGMGLMHCNVVRIDLRTFDKEVLYSDAILRGRCLSGEIVCITGLLMPSTFPDTNSMCRLYSMTVDGISVEHNGSQVLFLDPSTAEVVGAIVDDDALGAQFEEKYLDRSLEDILEEVGR